MSIGVECESIFRYISKLKFAVIGTMFYRLKPKDFEALSFRMVQRNL